MAEKSRRTWTVLLACSVVLLTLSLVVYPQEGFDAGRVGLKLFWNTVFPSLLPFFILSELLLGVGVVHALGVLLEPLMRPLFSVPGIGAFALSMGLAAGYPMDAVITAKFRRSKMCTRVEGERLLAFTNTADPLFMFGAVAVGMLNQPKLGMMLAIAHYTSALLVGLTFKLYGRKQSEDDLGSHGGKRNSGNLLVRSYRELISARREDNRPFGKLLGDAVNDSVRTLLMICGFIVFFSVLIRVLTVARIIPLLAIPFMGLFHLLGLSPHLIGPFMSGLLEIDIGSAQAATAAAPMVEKLMIISAIIAWSGLSVHAQVASVLTETDIRFLPYVVARMLHAVFAAVITLLLWNWGMGQKAATIVFAPAAAGNLAHPAASWWDHFSYSLHSVSVWAGCIAAAALASALIYTFRNAKLIAWSSRPKGGQR